MRSSCGKFLIGLVALALAPAAALADVKSGVEAWQRGDFSGAVRQWRPLADQGDPDAQFNMGQAYKLGRGVPSDLRIAQSWYQKAAAQGHDKAQANLGLILFESGKRAAAMPWLKKAAESGDARAQYVLGTATFNGEHVAKDWPRAYALMTRAAAQGLPQAANSLAQMDQYIPLPDRQRGIALAQQMARGVAPAIAPIITKASRAPAPAAAAAVAPRTAPVQQVAAPRAVAGTGWRAQLGAYGSPAAAQAQWASLSRRIAGLAGLQPSYEQAGKFTRLRAGPLASKAVADKVCAAAKAAGQPCFPVAP